jgi:RNA polymerase sigma-70 factor (ECF subfamily)
MYQGVMTNRCKNRMESDSMDSEARVAEQSLVRECLQGDDLAWHLIVRRYAGRIFCLCRRYTGRREEAEDLTQEIFIRIYQNLRTFRTETGSFQNWAMRLSRNLIIDKYRQTKRSPLLGGSWELEEMHLEDQSQPDPQRCIEQAEASRLIGKALRALSQENKEAIILRDLQGMGYHEMAKVLGVPEGTVKSRINRGRLALAKQLSRSPALREMRANLPAPSASC